MNIIINYDLIKAIHNVKEPFTPIKIVKNEKARYIMYLGLAGIALCSDINNNTFSCSTIVGSQVFFQLGFSTSNNLLSKRDYGMDSYAYKAHLELKKLASQLDDLNISTDYDGILESELYYKCLEWHLGENKIPYLEELKYIWVPSYKMNGDIENVSILQEHILGSDDYVLSAGSPSPKKVLKPSFSNI